MHARRRRWEDAADWRSDEGAAAAAAGMDFETFSKLLAMDTHRPRDAGALFVKMYVASRLHASVRWRWR